MECKFLGVILDNKLNWKAHCTYLSRKLSKSIGILSKARIFFEKNSMFTPYFSFIYPYLLYSNIVWGNCDGVTLWPIFKMQKLEIRLIDNLTYRQSTSPSFKKLKLLKLPDQYSLSTVIFMYN